MNEQQQSIILLDLDNTLVHTTNDVSHPEFETIPHSSLHIHVRPFVREFLCHLMKNKHVFEFGFWTCGTPDYAQHVVMGLMSMVDASEWDVRILLTRDDATIINGSYVKDLNLVRTRYNASDVILLDDNAIHYSIPENVSHVCLVPPFYVTDPDAPRDRFLFNLTLLPMVRPPSPTVIHRPRPVRASSMIVPMPW
tara:strand:- start:27637 stop:28221 length:585 start_codon:yes stop_codon:yes gene_type:complete